MIALLTQFVLPMEVGESDQSIETLNSLPEELVFMIIGHIVPEKITSPCQLIEFFITLTALSKTNWKLRRLIQNDVFLKSLALIIAKRIENYQMPEYGVMVSSNIASIIHNELLPRIQDNILLIYELRDVIIIDKDVKKAEELLKELEFGAINTENGDPLIIDVAADGTVEMVDLLLRYGADVHASKLDNDFQGIITPLIAAINAGNFDMVNFLLENKANVNLGYKNNYPIFAAIRIFNRNNKILPFLLNAGADVEIKDKDGGTPIIATIENYLTSNNKDEWFNVFKIILLLYNKGANINAQKNDGDTALIRAVASGNVGFIRLLLNRFKPDITIKNDWDMDAIETGRLYAIQSRRLGQNYKAYDDIVSFLKDWAKLHSIEL